MAERIDKKWNLWPKMNNQKNNDDYNNNNQKYDHAL